MKCILVLSTAFRPKTYLFRDLEVGSTFYFQDQPGKIWMLGATTYHGAYDYYLLDVRSGLMEPVEDMQHHLKEVVIVNPVDGMVEFQEEIEDRIGHRR